MLSRSSIETAIASFRSLGPKRLAALGLTVVVSMGAIIGSAILMSRQDFEVAYVGLIPQDAPRISRALADSPYQFEMSSDGTRLMTRRGENARVRAYLAERGLPSSPGSGYELFDKVGPLGMSSFMQEVTRIRALEGEVARTIQLLKGVRAARVHIAFGEQSPLRRQRQPASASVVVRTDTATDRSQTEAIRQIVAAAVPGLATADVRVVSADGQVLAGGPDDGLGPVDRIIALERSVAQEIQNKVNRTLVPHLGLENFEVSVAVRLNTDKRQTSETTFKPEERVERSVRVTKEVGSSQNGPKTNVSVERNIPSEAGASANQGDQSRRSNQKRDELTNYEVGTRSTAVTSEGYRTDRMTVAVVVNNKRLQDINGGASASAALPQRIADIEKLVASAAGADPTRGDVITITAADFLAPARATDSEPEQGIARWLDRRLDLLLKIGAMLLATGILVFFGLRPAFRALASPGSTPGAAPRLEVIGERRPDAGRPTELAAADGLTMATALGTARDAPDQQLQRLVGEDPARAAIVLRRWLKETT